MILCDHMRIFYDIKTVLIAFVCFYESLKTLKLPVNKLWMSNIYFFSDYPPSIPSQHFLCDIRIKRLFHLIFAGHTAQKQTGPRVGSLIDPCHRAQLAYLPHGARTCNQNLWRRSDRESSSRAFQIPPFHGGSDVFAQIWARMRR